MQNAVINEKQLEKISGFSHSSSKPLFTPDSEDGHGLISSDKTK
jgi:hypothetical protein